MEDPILPLDLVCSRGEQLPWGLLSHNIFGASLIGQQICRVGLAISKLSTVSISIFHLKDVRRICTCFTSIGTLICGTLEEIKRSREATSIGWRTSPAIVVLLWHSKSKKGYMLKNLEVASLIP
jgi:hypothetical protein